MPPANNTRGRRSPEVAAQIAANRQQADEAPTGDLLPSRIELDEPDLGDAGQYDPEDLPMLYPGDIVIAKVVHSTEIGGAESWFTYGVQSRVQPEEDEEAAFARVCAVANGRVLEMIVDAEERIADEYAQRAAEAQARVEAARAAAAEATPNRIQPRSRQR